MSVLPVNASMPDKKLLSWLTQQTSLINRLKSCTSNVTLTVINQGFVDAGWWEWHNLSVKDSIFSRDIQVFANNQICWYARTLIPKSTYIANETLFDRLKCQNLGDIIYENQAIVRQSLEYYPIDKQCCEYHWFKIKGSNKLWLRKSSFTVDKQWNFFLIEIYLPELSKYFLNE